MTQALLLAAGRSSRAKTNKLLVSVAGQPLIIHAINSVSPFVDEIIVVIGHYHQALVDLLKDYPKVRLINNSHYQEGMFSSVLTGAQLISEDCFILPGDCPFVQASTYRALLESKQPIAVPAYQGKLGHPLFLRKQLISALRAHSPTSNLQVFRDQMGYQRIEVDDANILTDIDTPADLEAIDYTPKG